MVDLNAFFARPIKVTSFTWNVGSSVLALQNPWTLYFSNARVINRITNYRNIRCNLNVKIVLNGNGFHYGRILVSYLPFASIDTLTEQNRSVAQDAVEESQRMHLYLDPTNSQGGTMVLPFFHPKNNLNVVESDWDDMGKLTFRSLQALKHANGATDSVTVSTYCWLSDVHLSGPTSKDSSALVAQAGLYDNQAGDEYQQSPVSSVASTVAAIANSLSNVPIIKPFAKATELSANAIGAVAKLFGYSRPRIIECIHPYKPVYGGNMACANVPDTAVSLAMDAKQELTVDPRTCGLNADDELAIVNIAKKESYLTQFAWDIADAAETLLWNVHVNPTLFDTTGAGDLKEYHFTSMCYAAHPFTYWRGSIKFRFMIVASAHQKGRLRIVYDPWLREGAEYNTNYNTIIDLAEERDFTIEIGWSNSRSFLKIKHADDFTTLPFSTSDLANVWDQFTNGTLSVFVVNELTTPNSTVTNDVAVNVIVSAGDDFEVAVPSSHSFQDLTYNDPDYIAQAGLYDCQAGDVISHADADHTSDPSAPIQQEVKSTMGADELSTDNTLSVFLSDPVASFRTLMKRYSHSIWLGTSTSTTTASYSYFDMPNMPLPVGYTANGVHQVTTPINPSPYNFTNMTLLDYCTCAFAGYRGSVRWKYIANITSTQIGTLKCTHLVGQSTTPVIDGSYATTASTHSGLSLNAQAANGAAINNDSIGGTMVTPFENNPVLEVELPFYSFDRFIPTRVNNSAQASDRYHQVIFSRREPAAQSAITGLDAYCAAGEDYMPVFYIGPPVFYFDATKPTPV